MPFSETGRIKKMEINELLGMVGHGYTKIIRNRHIGESRPLDGKWNPYLSDFLLNTTVRIKNKSVFYPDLVDIDSKAVDGTTILKECEIRANFDEKSTATAIVGRVGIGKTSFLNWFRSVVEKRELYIAKIDYNNYPTPSGNGNGYDDKFVFSEIINDTLNKFNNYFSNVLQNSSLFKKNIRRELSIIKEKAFAQEFPNWESGFLSQSDLFRENFPNYNSLWLLTLLIYTANETFKKPVWMLMDNIDRLSPPYQKAVIQAAHAIYEAIIENSRGSGWFTKFHIITTARPETVALNDFDFEPFKIIRYPNPKILSIAKNRLYEALEKAAEENPVKTVMTIGNARLMGTADLANHIKKTLEKVFANFASIKKVPRKRLGSEKWHLDLVACNVRRFIKPWASILISGNFIDDLIFPDDTKEVNREFNVHRYVKMLIKGKYSHFIGNEKINGYGYNTSSPLFFNLFGYPRTPGKNNYEYAYSYLIYIRILQFLLGHEFRSGIEYKNFLNEFRRYFSPRDVTTAVKILLWARIIDEVHTGARDIGHSGNYSDISIKRESRLIATDTTKLYFHNILNEYDYISAMAMISYQLKGCVNEGKYDHEIDSLNYANATYCLLKSWLSILLSCYEKYQQYDVLGRFVDSFILKPNTSKPWQKAIDGCITALNSKKEYASQANLNFKASFLENVANDLIDLKEKGVNIIGDKIGKQYDE